MTYETGDSFLTFYLLLSKVGERVVGEREEYRQTWGRDGVMWGLFGHTSGLTRVLSGFHNKFYV